MNTEVSVIVATRNRKQMLERLLTSLVQQTLSPDRYEVIVVSDGSTDGSVEMVRALGRQHRNLSILESLKHGPAAARNAGIREAHGKYLAFTDDDCIASPDWLERLVEAFGRTTASGIQGRTTTDPSACTPLTQQMEILRGVFYVPTCNVAYRTEVINAIGGFDESFQFPHGEDTDLAWTVQKAGGIEFAAEAHIIHPPRRVTMAQRAFWVRYLESDFLLFRKHPDWYRRYCSLSPWVTIYYRTFILAQVSFIKESLKYLFAPCKPAYAFQGAGVVLIRWWNLIRFFPFYFKAARRYGRGSLKLSQIEPARINLPAKAGCRAAFQEGFGKVDGS